MTPTRPAGRSRSRTPPTLRRETKFTFACVAGPHHGIGMIRETSNSAHGAEAKCADASTVFSGEISEAFARAVKAAGGACDRFFRIADRSVCLRFAGPALAPFVTPALEHLAAPEDPNPDLTVGLWDTASTGVRPPGSHWKNGDYIARGEIKHSLGEHVQMSFSVASGMFLYYDMALSVAMCWVRRPENIVPWEFAAPLRPMLGWWAGLIGGQLAHGAAVGSPEGGVLLAARGGSGKSTLALACLEAGLLYAGDDYVLLQGDDPPQVRSLYNTAKLVPGHMSDKLPRLCELVDTDAGPDHDKAIIFLKDSHPGQLADGLPLRAIVVPRIAPAGKTSLRRASGIEVLTALAPTSIFQLPGAGPDALRTLGNIARRVPGYALDVGADLDENVAVIRQLTESESTHGR